MATVLRPSNATEVRDAIAWAVAQNAPLEIVAGGSKKYLGRPVQAQHRLDLTRLTGISDYTPRELVLTAAAATPLAVIDDALRAEKQIMAFEPPDFGRVLGGQAGAATLGGMIACNFGGPRRIRAGAPRDSFLGFTAVSGRAEVFKGGGRVIKNVTGYDIAKLLAGSHGTLAAMTEVTIKVLPAPERTATLVYSDIDDAAALQKLEAALSSPHEVSGAAHLPRLAATNLRRAVGQLPEGAATCLRVEGFPGSVAARCEALTARLGQPAIVLGDGESSALWRAIANVDAFADAPRPILWRVSVPPSRGVAFVSRVRQTMEADCFYDWGGGLVWLSLDGAAADAGAAAVRAALGGEDGHATLFRAPEALRRLVPVFHPQSATATALTERIKLGFDPERVLNPGRMYERV